MIRPSKRLTEVISLLVRLNPDVSAIKIRSLCYLVNVYHLHSKNELAFGDDMYAFPLLYFSCKDKYVDDWELINYKNRVCYKFYEDNQIVSCLEYEETHNQYLIELCKKLSNKVKNIDSLNLCSFLVQRINCENIIEKIDWDVQV